MRKLLPFSAAILFSISRVSAQCPPPPPPVVTHDTICTGQSAMLLASGPSGATFNWFTAPTGGNPVHTGPSFNTGPLPSTQTWYVEAAGCLSYALQFPANNDRVDCGNPPGNLFDLLGNGTIEAWVKDAPGEVIGKDQGPGNNVPKWFFGVYNGGMNFHINGPGYGGGHWIFSTGFSPPSGWYHVAVVKSGNDISFYYNGDPVGSGTLPAPVVSNNASLTIGWGEPCCQASGTIDEVRFYDNARTQAQIQASMNDCADPNGLIAYYPMNDGPGETTVTDYSGGGHHGTLVNMNQNTAWVTGYNLPDCSGTSPRVPVTAIVIPAPTATLSGSGSICAQGNTTPVNLTVSFTGSDPWQFVYTINGAPQQPVTTSQNPYTLAISTAGTVQLASVSDGMAICPGTVSGSATITLVSISATATPTHPSCFGNNNGSVSLSVSGGNGPYSYIWSNGSTSQNLSGLSAGTYTATITDANGCTQTASATLTDPPLLTATAVGANPICHNGSTGAIFTTVGGGAGPYTYNWSNGSTAQNPTGLPAGTYSGAITDANGCQTTVSVTLANPPQMTATATGTNPLCHNGNNGSISLTVGGGTPPYSFVWNTGSNAQNPSGLIAGNYSVTITDAQGCQQTALAALSNPLPIIAATQNFNPLCFGGNTGSIDLTVTNGGPPLSYNWSNGSSAQDPTGLVAATYAVTITDANGCTQTASATLTSPPQLNGFVTNVQHIDCLHPAGSISTVASGGTPGYSYQWAPAGSGPNPGGLPPGTYSATITDGNGCTVTLSSTVNADLTLPNAAASVSGMLTCMVPALTLSGAGSSAGPNISYQWTGPGIVGGASTLNPAVNLPGIYTLTVTNAGNGCVQTASVNVEQDISIPVAVATAPVITCSNPVATINGSGSSAGPDFIYLWTTSNGNIVSGATTLTPQVNTGGTYTMVVTNAVTGCQNGVVVNVAADMAAPVSDAGPLQELTCVVNEVQLIGSNSSQGANITYSWSTPNGNIVSGEGTMFPIVNAPGTYVLTVTNTGNGCFAISATEVVVDEDIPFANAGSEQFLTCAALQVALDGSQSSSGPQFSFQWSTSNGNIVSGENTLTPVVDAPGQYQLTIASLANGCQAAAAVTVTEDNTPPSVVILAPDDINCAHPEIVIDATGSSSQGNLSFVWSTQDGNIVSGQGDLSIVVDSGGTYTLSIINNTNGCQAEGEAVVANLIDIPQVAIADPQAITCSIPQISLDATGSSTGPNYQYSWTTSGGNIVSGENTLTPVVSMGGTYELIILDISNECLTSGQVLVEEDAGIPSIVLSVPDTLNCALTQVELNATLGNGTGLAYTWSTLDGNFVSGQQTLQPVVNAPGTYQIEALNPASGCLSVSQSLVIQDMLAPAVEAGPIGTLTCAIASLQLDGTGTDTGASYQLQWTTPDGNIVSGEEGLTPIADVPGTYFLTVTNLQNSCTTSDSVLVGQDIEVPVSSMAPPLLMGCMTPEIALDGAGSSVGPHFAYTWSTTNGQIVSGAGTLSPVVGAPGQYALLVENTFNGCSSEATAIVLQDLTLPGADAGPGEELNCILDEYTLQGAISGQTAHFEWAWTAQDGNLPGGSQTLTPVITEPGAYILTVVDTLNGCVTSDTVVVTQDADAPLAIVEISNPLNCAFPAVTLDGTGSSQGPELIFTWSTSDGHFASGTGSLSPVIDQPGAYILEIVDDGNGCSAAAQVEVEADFAVPTVDAGAGGVIDCDNATLVLSGSGDGGGAPLSWLWSTQDGALAGGADTPAPLVNTGGTYVLTLTNLENGCANSDIVFVGEDLVPPLANAGPQGLLNCFQPQIQLDGGGSSPGNAFEYLWTSMDGLILDGESSLFPTVGAAGNYLLVVTNTVNHCVAQSSVVVVEDFAAPQAEAGPPADLTCVQTSLALAGTGSGASNNLSFSWATVGGSILSGGDTPFPVVGAPGLYILTVTDQQNGCAATDEVWVGLKSPEAPDILLINPACMGDKGRIEVLGISGGEPPYMYSVDGGMTFQGSTLFLNLAPGDYSIVVQDASGCETVPAAESISDPGPVMLDIDATISLLQGASYQVWVQTNVPAGEIQSISWSPATGLSCADCLDPVATPAQTTAYEVVIQTKSGCLGAARVQFIVDKRVRIFAPNIFSPNGDGQNDVFHLFAQDRNIAEIRSFRIFSRWGESVWEARHFQPNDPGYGWDGTQRGKPMNPAVFAWHAEVELIDGRVEYYWGDVVLAR